MFHFAPLIAILGWLAFLSGCDRQHRPIELLPKIAVGRIVVLAPPTAGGANPDAAMRNALETQLQLRDKRWVGSGSRPRVLTGELKVITAPNRWFPHSVDSVTTELAGEIRDGNKILERKIISREFSNGLDEAAYRVLAEELVNAFFPLPKEIITETETDTVPEAEAESCWYCWLFDTVPAAPNSETSTTWSTDTASGRQDAAPPRAVNSSVPRSHSGGSGGEHASHTSKPPADPVAASVPRSHPNTPSDSGSSSSNQHRRTR